jgi:hypothetical protein
MDGLSQAQTGIFLNPIGGNWSSGESNTARGD